MKEPIVNIEGRLKTLYSVKFDGDTYGADTDTTIGQGWRPFTDGTLTTNQTNEFAVLAGSTGGANGAYCYLRKYDGTHGQLTQDLEVGKFYTFRCLARVAGSYEVGIRICT